MTDFASDLITTAQDILSEFGEQGTFTRIIEGTYNPDAGESFGETVVLYMGMIVPVTYKDYEIDGTIIQKGDIKIIAPSMAQVPQPDDVLTFGVFSGKIIHVMHTRTAGQDIIYTLQVRK